MLLKCLKKDFLGLYREKKNLIIFLLPIIGAIFSIIILVALDAILGSVNTTGMEEELAIVVDSFRLTYEAAMGTFFSFAGSYFSIVLIILLRNVCTKEIKSNQWVLPINAGFSPKDLYLSKLFSYLIMITIAILIGYICNFIFIISACDPNGITIGMVLYNYLTQWLFMLMVANMLISFDYITGKSWIGTLIVVLIIFLVGAIIGSIEVGDSYLMNFTPIYWYNQNVKYTIGSTLEVIMQYLVFAIIMVVLPLIAVFKNKMKSSKKI